MRPCAWPRCKDTLSWASCAGYCWGWGYWRSAPFGGGPCAAPARRREMPSCASRARAPLHAFGELPANRHRPRSGPPCSRISRLGRAAVGAAQHPRTGEFRASARAGSPMMTDADPLEITVDIERSPPAIKRRRRAATPCHAGATPTPTAPSIGAPAPHHRHAAARGPGLAAAEYGEQRPSCHGRAASSECERNAEDRDGARMCGRRRALVRSGLDGGARATRTGLRAIPGLSPQTQRRPQHILRRKPDRAGHLRHREHGRRGISRRDLVCGAAGTARAAARPSTRCWPTARDLARELSGTVQDAKGMPFSPQRTAALREDVARFQALLR